MGSMGGAAQLLASDLLAREATVDEMMREAAASSSAPHLSPQLRPGSAMRPLEAGAPTPLRPPRSNGADMPKAPGTPARSDALLAASAAHNSLEERASASQASDIGDEDDRGDEEEANEEPPQPCILRTSHMGLAPPSQPAQAAGPDATDTTNSIVDMSASSPRQLTVQAEWPRSRIATRNGEEVLDPTPGLEGSQVLAWGCAHNFQLGDGGYMAQASPVRIKSLARLEGPLADMHCGADHCMAIDTYGGVYSWGLSELGRLGHGEQSDCQLPKKIQALKHARVVSVACGMYSSACIDDRMRVYTWGAGGDGQLGHGEEQDEWIPRVVRCLVGRRIVHISLGDRHTAAVCADGDVYTWGSGEAGQLGDGTSLSRVAPCRIDAGLLGGACTVVCCGFTLTCVLRADGRIAVWGRSEYGALGLGAEEGSTVPRVLSSNVLDKRCFVSLAVGEEHVAAVTANGGLYAWGQGCFGAVGKAPQRRGMHPPDVRTPRRAVMPQGVKAKSVSCGGNYTAVLCTDGTVMAMGDDDVSLRVVAGGTRAAGVRCGRFHTSLLVSLEEVRGSEVSWGSMGGAAAAFSRGVNQWLGWAWGEGAGKEAGKYQEVSQGSTVL